MITVLCTAQRWPLPKELYSWRENSWREIRRGRKLQQIQKVELPDTESRVISIITLLLPAHAVGLVSRHKPASDGLIDKTVLTAHQQMQSLLLLPHQACAVLDMVSKTKSSLLMSAIIIQQIR